VHYVLLFLEVRVEHVPLALPNLRGRDGAVEDLRGERAGKYVPIGRIVRQKEETRCLRLPERCPAPRRGILQPAKRPASCSACLAAAVYTVASCAPSESECAILATIWQQDSPGDDQARLGPVTANHESSLPGRQSREGTRLPARPEEARGGLDRTSRAERRHAGSRYVRESEIGGIRGISGIPAIQRISRVFATPSFIRSFIRSLERPFVAPFRCSFRLVFLVLCDSSVFSAGQRRGWYQGARRTTPQRQRQSRG